MLNRIKSNSAAGITFMGIFGVLLIVMLGIWIVDIAMMMNNSRQYQLAAQRATQTAIKEQNMVGGLKADAANKFLDEYKILTEKGGDAAFSEGCRSERGYPKITIYFDKNRDTKGGDVTFTSSAYGKVGISEEMERQFRKKNYKVIGVSIEDAVRSYFTASFAEGCKVVHIDASAITSSSKDEDKYIDIIETDEENNENGEE